MAKTIIITGGSDGIGAAAARLLKEQGETVVIVGRSPDKTRQIAQELDVPYFIADFSRLSEVKKLALQLKQEYPAINVLVNNAGGIFGKRTITEDSHEITMQVNHLAHFLLTELLMETLIKSKATIINTSSEAHRLFGTFDINNIELEHGYNPNRAYGYAKFENILFSRELHRRYNQQGIKSVAFHPGVVATSFARNSSSFFKFLYHSPLQFLFKKITPDKGAETLIWLATTNDWQSGEYYYKRKVKQATDIVYDDQLAESLWSQSQEMIKSHL